MRRVLLALLMLACLAGCGAPAGEAETVREETDMSAEGTELEVYCFSAGKADAFLLTTAESAVLIDAGEKGFGKTILAELEARGIGELDALIITHFDQDHVGGAARVLNTVPVRAVYQSNAPKDSEEYEKYVKALKNAAIEPLTVRELMNFTLDGIRYRIDPPRKGDYQEDGSNNSSLMITVENGAHRLLFTGDAQTERLEEYLDSGAPPCDVLKVPHHGKEEPLLEALVEAVQPAYAVITSSDEEPEDESTLALLEGAEVFLTRTAPVVIRSDGRELSVEYAK